MPRPPSSAAATRAAHSASRLVSRRGTGFSAAAIRNGQNHSLPQKPSHYAQQIRQHTPFPTVSKQTNRTRLSRQTIAFQTASAASKLPSQHKTTQATHKCRLKIQTAA
ncbi:hypothetical protein [Neisseria blantyrii]|uniref:hypothetical protein n=1 Tax=Neisseria blantyrii TaxID=2830647 RepID=UPI00272D2F52|nr:hypothetical protein [Neisseria blantyrii]